MITPDDVSNIRFTPTRLRSGYKETQVDQFLDLVEKDFGRLLDGSPPTLTAYDIRHVQFATSPIGGHGYDMDEVDQFLDLVEAEFRRLTAQPAAGKWVGLKRHARSVPTRSARRLTELAVRALPGDRRVRYREEFAAELAQLAGDRRWRQWIYAARLVVRAVELRRALADRPVRFPARER